MEQERFGSVSLETPRPGGKAKFIIAGVVILAIAILAYVIFSFKNSPPPQNVVLPGTSIIPRDALLNEGKEAFGKIKSISRSGANNSMLVEAELFDLSDTQVTVIDLKTARRVVKELSIGIASNTGFVGKKFEEFREGDTIRIVFNESPYLSETLTAKEIRFIDRVAEKRASIVGNPHEIFGTITAVKRGVTTTILTLKTRVVDASKVDELAQQDSFVVPYVEKTYTATLNTETNVIGKENYSPSIGDSVKLTVKENIYETTRASVRELMYLGPSSSQ